MTSNAFLWKLKIREVGLEHLLEQINPRNVNEKDQDGATILHACAKSEKYSEFVLKIIAMNGDVDSRDKLGNTPLHVAAESSQIKIAKILLANGADVNTQNKKMLTPLEYVVNNLFIKKLQRKSYSMDDAVIKMAELLYENGANLSIKDNTNTTLAESLQTFLTEDEYNQLFRKHG